jgi:transcription elongation factor GreA
MSLKMAVDALQTLSKNHIWVLKATWKKEKLREKVKTDHAWALKTVIMSFKNSCDLKRIKQELSPAVLSAGEWTGWSGKAREILKSDPGFGVSPENIDVFTVRERSISIGEKLYNEFKAEKGFFERAATIRSFVNQKDPEIDSEYFSEMFNYLTGFLRNNTQANEQTVASYLIAKDLADKYPHLRAGLPLSFEEVFNKISDVPSLFKKVKDNKFKEEFLHNVQLFIPQWPEIYVKLFPYALNASIIESLEKEAYDEKLRPMVIDCFENFKEYKEAVLWLYKNAARADWFKEANIPLEKQLITLVYILDISYRDIENHRDTSESRKINKQVYTILFKDGVLNSFIAEADPDSITRIYTFINDVKDLDPQDKLNLRSRIIDKYPNFKFFGDVEKRVSRGLMVTSAKFEEKRRQLAHIMDVEVPANSREIEAARLHGDLKENAEYIAAKEKQQHLNSQVAKLNEEIERAQIFDPNSLSASKASFGTRVTLHNDTQGRQEEYVLLGPWESDPDNNIISYLSPFGAAIMNKIVGEHFDFTSEEKITYTVEQISAASI